MDNDVARRNDTPEGRFVTNRELYTELKDIRTQQTRLWIAVTAVGGVNVSALLRSFGGPDVVGLAVSFVGGLF
jgi:hypothetical protein